jgi:DNA-binding LacI/PurR family transcriptional regulator
VAALWNRFAKYEIGRAAVEILLRLAREKDKQAPEHRLPGVQLIERQSCRQHS